jgi:hypothetical protein
MLNSLVVSDQAGIVEHLHELEHAGITEAVFCATGPDISRELHAFAAAADAYGRADAQASTISATRRAENASAS